MILSAGSGLSQTQPSGKMSNVRIKKIPVLDIPISIDTLVIVPGTLKINSVHDSTYYFDLNGSRLYWNSRPSSDSVTIQYRVFPSTLGPGRKGLNYDSIRFHFLAEPVTINSFENQPSAGLFDLKGIRSEGSIGRFLSFGNAQDAVVNSSLNLQLHGFVADSLELTAAITDNNIPFQPDGDTRDLRDFDRIFIQARKKNWQVSLGDIDQRYLGSHFLNFYKRLQGLGFSSTTRSTKGIGNTVQFAGAIAKGKFSRNILTPEEGNQGPYRLKGANNELFFVILAGTERVYLDGELLRRGEDGDYVINYNTAELRFTPRRLMQKDRRIQVEFEYADRNYLNSQIFFRDEIDFKNRFSVNVAAYSNMDARNSTIDQPLSSGQKSFLAGIGDSLTQAFYDNATREDYQSGKTLYVRKDTLYGGGRRDTIYQLSADSSAALYAVSFTYLGYGKGNYRQILNVTNGKAFEWIQPDDNGQPQGDWAPVSRLVTPKKQQILTAGMRYRPSEKTEYYLEGAVSISDQNLFSTKDKADNEGKAIKALLKQHILSYKTLNDSMHLMAGLSLEKVQETFRPVERLRNIEFLRDWSLPLDTRQQKEDLNSLSLSMESKNGRKIGYELTSYKRGSYYSGLRHLLDAGWKLGSLELEGRFNRIAFDRDSVNGDFFRPSATIRKPFKKIANSQLELKYLGEFNRETTGGILTTTSFAFQVYEMSLRSGAQTNNPWSLSYFRRQDALPENNVFLQADRSDNWAIGLDLLKDPRHQLRMSAQFRKLSIINEKLSKRKPEKTILSRTDYSVIIRKGLISGNLFYEFGNGQELKREFAYVQVPAGQGQYTWIDYNGNGIEELNEFETGLYQDQKNYIRVYTPGNEYVKSEYLQFNYSLDINPRIAIKTKNGFRGLLSRSNLLSVMQIGKRQIADGNSIINPFIGITDSNLVSVASYFSNSFFFNRSDPSWGLECTHTLNTDRALLVYGLETRRLENLVLRSRLRIRRNWVGSLAIRQIQNDLGTSGKGFGNRNFNISQKGIEPSFTYTHRSHFRLVVGMNLTQKVNNADSAITSNSRELNTEIRYNASSGTAINVKLAANEISWSGSAASKASTVGFQMLSGLQPGNNFIWTIDLTRRLGNNLEMNLQYEGRKPDSSATVHIGRAGVRALF